MMPVLVKIPTRSRPQRFLEVLEMYKRDPSVELLVSVDRDDATMNNVAMIAILESDPRVIVRVGDSTGKVEAINDGLLDEPWDGVLILASDDFIPQRPDYGQRIAELFEEFFPEGDGVLHLNDGRVGRVLNTLPILDRKYFNRFGYVYNPVYKSLHCDNEFQDVSERLGRAVYVNEVIIKHDWIGEHAPDPLHHRNESFYARDGKVYEARKRNNFLPS